VIPDCPVILGSQVPQVSLEPRARWVRSDHEAAQESRDPLDGVVSLASRAIQAQSVLLDFQGHRVLRDRPDSQEPLAIKVRTLTFLP